MNQSNEGNVTYEINMKLILSFYFHEFSYFNTNVLCFFLNVDMYFYYTVCILCETSIEKNWLVLLSTPIKKII